MTNTEMHKKITDAFYFRHACKKFDPEKKINNEDIKLILESARFSPSSFWLEWWKFIVLQNQGLREKLIPFTRWAEKWIPTASHLVLILSRKAIDMKSWSEYINKMFLESQKLPEKIADIYKEYFKNFQEKDFVLDTEEKINERSSKQAYIPLTNMMTTASLLWIDSCAVEWFDIAKTNSFLKEELDIDTEHFEISTMLTLGYRIKEPREKTRLAFDEVVEFIE